MVKVKVQEHKNHIVKKHNELIKAQGALSSTAYKMLCSVISMIKADDSEFQEYALKRDEYLKMIGSTSNNDKFIYEQAEQLMQNPFKVEGKLFNWCSMVDFERIPGYIIFDIHPKLKPYLLELRDRGNITQYKIINILSLKGDYTPRLYELIVSEWNTYGTYNKNSKSYTFELELDFLRDTLSVPKSYAYADIKRRIIEVAQKQFKERANIKFDYKEQKLGRKVVRLQITVKENLKGSNDPLATLKSFIKHLRDNYKNKDLYHVPNKQCLSISDKGLLYDKYQNEKIDNKRSQELWEKLYNLAKENKLPLIQE